MKNTFLLTEPEVDDLLRDFRHRRDVADANERTQEAATWSEAIREIERVQLESFRKRGLASKPRKSLTR